MKEVKFEVVELYPMYGSLGAFVVFNAHIFMHTPFFLMDIRGFTVHISKNEKVKSSKVFAPTQVQYDYEEKKGIRFPVIDDINKAWIEEVEELLISEGKKRFSKFKAPKGFPKTFKDYLLLMKKNRTPPKPKEADGNKETNKKFLNFASYKKK